MLIDVQVPGYLIQVVDRVGAVAVVRVGRVLLGDLHLGQVMAERVAHAPHVVGIDRAVHSYIFTEVRTGYGHADLVASQSHIRAIDGLGRVHVAGQHVHAHHRAGQGLTAAAHDVGQSHSDLLHIAYSGQVDRHGVTGENGTTRDAARAGSKSRRAADYIVTKGEDQRVAIAGVAAFHSGLAGKRQRNSEALCSLSLD